MSTLLVPVQTLNWRILSNVAVGNSGNGTTDYKDFWLKLKRILTGHSDYSGSWKDTHGASASAPTACTVLMSSDSVTGPTSQSDTTDRWATTSNIVSAGGLTAHSWICLGYPGIGSGAQLLIDVSWGNAGSGSYLYTGGGSEVTANPASTANCGGFFFSHTGGFNTAGQYGTNARRAWASDETQVARAYAGSNGVFLGGLSATTTWTLRLHVMRTSDGAITRVVACSGGVPVFFLWLEVPGTPFHTNASPDHTWNVDDIPWFGGAFGANTLSTAGLYNGTSAGGWVTQVNRWVSRIASNTNPAMKAVASMSLVVPYSAVFGDYLVAVNTSAPNAGDAGYVPVPIGLANGSAGYTQPWMGSFQDLYLIGSNLTDGSSGAEDTLSSGYSWRKIGNFLIPWDRSTMLLS